jgi:hypothetical protein
LSRAGKANEVGSVFRCVVATHLAVHGLRGRPVSGLDLPAGVFPVRLDFETDDPTDDIRVTFSTGRRAYVSAKRKVSKGSPLKETIDGWVKQTPTLGPDGLLAIAGEEFVGPAKHLARALRRHRKGLPMESESERTALSVIDNLLPATVRDIVLDRARVLRLQGSTDSESFKDFLAALMDHVVDGEQGPQAVDVLSALLHRQAGQALGSGIDDWVAALNGAGLKVIADQGGPAGRRAAAKLAAVGAYRDRLQADAGRIDLSLLAEDLPPIVVEDLIDGLRIQVEGERSSDSLLKCLRRWRRMLIVGQPGSGKSVALREIAAQCAADPHAPVPIRVVLPRLMQSHPERWTIDALIDVATADVASNEQRVPLATYLVEELAQGRALILCDGLDECGTQAPWAAQQLSDILGTLHPRAGFVLATRANSQIPAARLGLPRVELEAPHSLSATVDRVLAACAETRVAEGDREAWLETRRAWLRDVRKEHDELLSVPLLAVLLALICARAADADLPKGRAALLHRAVQESVDRWEQTREAPGTDRPWSPALTTAILLDGFIVLGRLLDGGVAPPRAYALEVLSTMLADRDQWGMPPAQAREVAEQVLRFWDEHVAVFVVNAADELTTRSKVFAEIATAMWTTSCTHKHMTEWLTGALVYTDSDGAIALAAGLDSRTVDALLELGANGQPDATLMVADLVIRRTISLTSGQLDLIFDQLSADAIASLEGKVPPRRGPKNPPNRIPKLWDETRDTGPWPFVQAACLLALPKESRGQRAGLIAASHLDHISETIAIALCALTDAAADDRSLGNQGAEAVNAALAIPTPPKTKLVKESRRRTAVIGGGRLAPGLDHVALAAADRLDELADDAGERAAQIAEHATGGIGDRIHAALRRAGIETNHRWREMFANSKKWRDEYKARRATLLSDIGSLAAPDRAPDEKDFWSLTDIGDLLAATGYLSVGSREFNRAFIHDTAETRREWLDALAAAYGINKAAVAEQARYLESKSEAADDVATENDDWFVAYVTPLVEPVLVDNLRDRLSTEQQQALLACLKADSDWIAYAAAQVLVYLEDTLWDCRELFATDMSAWPIDRAGLLYSVAMLTAGNQREEMLAEATTSDSVDYRYAARMTISIASQLDLDSMLMKTLRRDPDLAVRPKDARKESPVPAHWTCNECRSVNDLDVEDCPGCEDGVRPES